MTKEIELTQGKVALVDDEDFYYLNQWKWSYLNGYAKRTEDHSRSLNGKQNTIYMHRLIAKPLDNMETDHKNRNKLDNRKANLRNCSHAQNSANQNKNKGNTSGYRGVHWNKKAGKWRARVQGINLGYFDNIIQAAKAYDDAAKKHFGEFANLNFPKS